MMETFFDRTDLKYAMIGGGSWATAIVKILLNHQKKISWYLRRQTTIDCIIENQHNPSYLQSVFLDPGRLDMSTNINKVVKNSDVIIFCIPSAYFVKTITNLTLPLNDKFIISAVKGFVSEENLTIAEYFHEKYDIPFDRIGVISGPCHAEEISMERLSYLTLSSKHMETAEALCKVFACSYVKAYPCTDIYGVEYSASLKNIYAIAAGICHALGYGDNFMAVLMTNSFHEISSFIQATHPDENRVMTSSPYLGDLLVTGYSNFSRNRTFGSMIGKGYSVKSARMEMNMVAEGYYASKSIKEINKKYQVDMPIADAVYEILYEKRYPPYIIKQLTDKLR
ncbi:MAG: NAD(P)H-dependent glycerol-3-phosphate dehydrogenase [Bacteroidales bacterium]|jgi:glycerol-3-phosphate dehydrogenase (NAD(P)+)|nr:NAD(P)H-dependent glycerol-3-phosphate dehydrogenase [Bacteroidales bacterium]